MNDQVLQRESIIKAPLEKVFDFFSNAKNLEIITPPFLNFTILEQSTPKVQKGTIFTYRLKVHGIPIRWKSLIEEWVPNSHFVDTQIFGPYKKWHHLHTFKSVPEGTWMQDTVNYRVHMGILGHWLTGRWVRKDVESIFTFRESKIQSIFHA
ncbi:MAG: SRPBCC family protein [Bdellovibrionota bacterium]